MTNQDSNIPENRRFSQEQYDMLKRCSDKKDMTEWNEWRKAHPTQEILLEDADLDGMNLNNIDLSDYGGIACTPTVFLKGASLSFAHLEGAKLHKARLEGVLLNFAHLDKAFLLGAHLENARLQCVKLRDANLCNTYLDRSNFIDSHLQDSEFDNACLIGAKFRKARISGSTSFCYCEVDHETDFREVGLDSVRIDSVTKQLLEYNIRRMNWEEWYKEHRIRKWPIRWFWCFSDYGKSAWRVIIWFFGLALAFAAIYANCVHWWPPGIVDNLEVEPHLPLWHYFLLLFLRPIYFSIVTMTTLGFGDIYANVNSIWGHVLLTFQVILGYVLLGALVTRFAVLFTAGGPAGRLADEKSVTDRIKQLWSKVKGKDVKRT